MIRSQELNWHIQRLNEISHLFTSVVRGIVNNNDCVRSPRLVHCFQMHYKLFQKVKERHTVCLPLIDRKESFSITTHASNDIYQIESASLGSQIVLSSRHPSSFPMVCCSQYALINVDQPFTTHHMSYEISGCWLSLQLSRRAIMLRRDRTN